MPKVEIYDEGRCYCILDHDGSAPFGHVVELTDEEIAEYDRIQEIYSAMQTKLHEWIETKKASD